MAQGFLQTLFQLVHAGRVEHSFGSTWPFLSLPIVFEVWLTQNFSAGLFPGVVPGVFGFGWFIIFGRSGH